MGLARGAPLVGREPELTLLRNGLARVQREREPQLVTIIGEPGIGKSRLVSELFRPAGAGPEPRVSWRVGRSHPPGEGATLWALAEIVKAQAGILDSDSPEQADQKLRRAVENVITDVADAAWVERHLRPLVGLDVEEIDSGNRREEAFAAWRHFLVLLAEQRPLVLVFEDLHWADGLLLDFIDHIVDQASKVAMLILATARSELLSHSPSWDGGKENSATISLSPLSRDETTLLVEAWLGRVPIGAERRQLLDSAGGNPLHAEEFARWLREREEFAREFGERFYPAALPESLHGIIAARLDTLSRYQKELIQAAAVMGNVCWLGAFVINAFWLDPPQTDRATKEKDMQTLEREFVRRKRHSSVAGEAEYAFRHALIRDLVYRQIPEDERAHQHRVSADWFQSLGRPGDRAEMIAHHWVVALDHARATDKLTSRLSGEARIALRMAGDRAFSLSAFGQAAEFYQRALELGPKGERAELAVRYGHALELPDHDRGI